MFHPEYKDIIDKLPESLVERACQRLLNHSRNPVPLELISEKSDRIEGYLQHTLDIYENSLKRKRKTMDQKNSSRPKSWPECSTVPALPVIYVTDSEAQTDSIPCNREEENNRQVMNELKVLSQHLLDYNRKTFGKFMQDIDRDFKERVSANKKLRYEVSDLKMQVHEAEKKLASM